jgi:hypothetical protein
VVLLNLPRKGKGGVVTAVEFRIRLVRNGGSLSYLITVKNNIVSYEGGVGLVDGVFLTVSRGLKVHLHPGLCVDAESRRSCYLTIGFSCT